MKLSDMQAMLDAIKADASPSNPDPDVRFYMPRPEGLRAGPRESMVFVAFDLCGKPPYSDHKIVALAGAAVQRKGDFDLPIAIANFYRE